MEHVCEFCKYCVTFYKGLVIEIFIIKFYKIIKKMKIKNYIIRKL